MATTTIWQITARGALILLALAVITTVLDAQDLILNGNITNNNLIRVARDVINNTTGPVAISGTGVIRLDRNVFNHSIRSSSGSYPITFSNLSMTQGRPVTCQVDVTVVNSLQIGDASNPYTAGGNGFDIGTRTLTINNASSYLVTSTAALTFSNGTVIFNSGSAQSILNRNAGVTYGTLQLSGNGVKSIQAGGTVSAVTLTQADGALSVTENLTVTGSATIADLSSVSNGKTLLLANSVTSASVTSANYSGSGTISNQAPTGSISFTNAAVNNGAIENTSTGTIDFNNDLTGTGSISQTGNGIIEVGGVFTQNSYSLNAGTVIYNSSAADQNVVGTIYNNLTLNNNSKVLASAATINGDLTLDASSSLNMNNNNASVAGNVVLGNNITTGSGVLSMTSTIANNVTGSGEILGAVRRAHDFAVGQNYRFNRADIYIATAATVNSDITLRMIPASDPTNPASTKYVQRRYEINPTTMGNLQAIQLYYASGELQGGITESKIGLRAYDGANWAKVTNPGMTRNSGSNLMTYSGLNNSLASASELGMYGINFVTAANGANISTAAGWDENQMPDNNDDAVIAHTGVVTGDAAVNVSTLTIDAGRDLSTNGSGALTVANSTDINGTINITNTNANLAAITIGSNGSISVSSGRTLTGTTLINNSSTASTFTGNVSLSSLANNGSGVLNFNGNNSSISGAVTNEAGATISVGGTLNMMTASPLSLVSNGNITVNGASGILNIGGSGVASNLTMSGTSTLTLNNATAQLNVYGNLELGATATLNNLGIITIGE